MTTTPITTPTTTASNTMRIGALQIGASPEGTQTTLQRILAYRDQISSAKCDLIVLPEAILGGYPKGSTFGTKLGFRTPEGRDDFLAYWQEAVDLDGEEVQALCELAKSTQTALVVGIIERSQTSTLYCTSLFINTQGEYAAKHRKLMPTGSERLIWGQGDGSTLSTMKLKQFTVGSAICWENYMPLMRTAMYAKGVNVWCAPTVDDRDIWQASMRHIAYEGRMFLACACQYLPAAEEAQRIPEWPAEKPLIRGGSVIISPMGDVLAGPILEQEGLIFADIDMNDVVRARYDFDVTGHYARPDVFQLRVDEAEKRAVCLSENTPEKPHKQ